MSLFYRLAFRFVFFFTKLSDDRKHKTNRERKDVHVRRISLSNKQKMNVLSDHRNLDKKEPLLFDIHGGGWLYGDENLNLDFGKWYAQRGFKVALPSYSLVYDNNIKTIVHELYEALAFLKENAEGLALDLSKAVIVGDSAGAGLALLLLSISQSEELQKVYGVGKLPIEFSGCALYHPCCYPKKLIFVKRPKLFDRSARRAFLRMYCGKEEYERLLSVADFSDYADKVSRLCPMLVMTSLGDQFLKYQTDRLVKDLDEHHLSYAYLCIPDRKFGHVVSVTQVDEDHCQKANEQVLAFLRSTID